MPRSGTATRNRILAAADELFYRGNLRAVGVDDVADRAGVTKRTLYCHFQSKDRLFAAYLEARDRSTLGQFQEWAGNDGSVADRMDRIFRQLGRVAHLAEWNGCGFSRAAGELVNMPDHPAQVIARTHKMKLELWLRKILKLEGRNSADLLARSLVVLVDGAVTQMLIHRSPHYAEAARVAAAALLRKPAPASNGRPGRLAAQSGTP